MPASLRFSGDEVWATFPLEEPWQCEYRCVVADDGEPVFTELRLTTRDGQSPASGVTTRLLRTLPVGRHLASTHAQLAKMAREGRSWEERDGAAVEIPAAPGRSRQRRLSLGAADLDRQAVEAAGFGDVAQPRARPGRPGRPDAFYAEVASRYVDALDSGSRRPTADVAENLNYSAARVRDAVHEARERGLLSRPAAKGRPGGALTDRAKKLLAAGAS